MFPRLMFGGRKSGDAKRSSATALTLALAVSTLAIVGVTAALTLGGDGAAAASTPGAGLITAASGESVPPDREFAAPSSPTPATAGRVIVQWQSDADRAERVEARAAAGVTPTAELGDPTFQLVETTSGEGAAAAAAALEADPAVAVAEPDGMRRLEALPNDPLIAQQWGIRNTGQTVEGLPGQAGNDIDVVDAWDRTVGTPSTVVADIDSGYRFDSPDLGPVAWTNPGEIPGNNKDDDKDGYVDDVHGWDFVGENSASPTQDADPTDGNLISGGHGVHTAGILGAAGNDGTGISGVARNARIMPLRVCSNEPSTNETRCPYSAIIAAINFAGDHGARVANLSLGGTTFSQLEVNAYASHPGTLYVIAAGNDGANNDSGGSGATGHHYPCDYRPAVESSPAVPGAIENTICVAALDPSGSLASYSDYGATSVDLGAPGTAVISTYPASETLFSDDFETNDFATKWSTFSGGFGRAGAGDGPLTSFGITDTPGGTPSANGVYDVELNAGIQVPAGAGACRISGRRFRKGGSFPAAPYGVVVDESDEYEFEGAESTGTSMTPFRSGAMPGLGGHSVMPFFEYRAGSAPTAADGIWLDDISFSCNSPLSVPPSYSYLDGTSMATPHVTGAAALLFSLAPGASVAQVREALLGTTAPVPGLAGKTTTGGRLDVDAALDQLVPPGSETTAPDTGLTTSTPATTAETVARFHASRLDADGGTFECSLGATEAFEACGSELEVSAAPGAHTLQVRAKNEAGIVDPTPAVFNWTVTGAGVGGGGSTVVGTLPPGTVTEAEEKVRAANPGAAPASPPSAATPAPSPTRGCTVPKLAGKALGAAKAALGAAGCTLGRVSSPRVKRGDKSPKLVVRSQTPSAGSHTSGPVSLTLAAAKPRRHHH